jgi:hypothetical protein
VRRDSLLSCCGVRGEVVREDLKDPTSWKKRLGYGQRWMVEAFFIQEVVYRGGSCEEI